MIDYAQRLRTPTPPLVLPGSHDGTPTMIKLDAPAADADLYERLVQRGHRVQGLPLDGPVSDEGEPVGMSAWNLVVEG